MRVPDRGAVAGGEDVRIGGGKVFVDRDAVLDCEAGGLGEAGLRDHADGDDHGLGGKRPAVGEAERAVLGRDHLDAEIHLDAFGAVARDEGVGKLRQHRPAEGTRGGLEDGDRIAAGAKRRGELEADQAGADDHDGFGPSPSARRRRASATVRKVAAVLPWSAGRVRGRAPVASRSRS